MPSTLAARSSSRLMIGPTRSTRSLSGLRLISSRPVFIVVFTPSMPTTEDTEATAGSLSSASTSAC